MKFQSTELAGVVLVEPDVHRDARGYFLETYHADKYRHGGLPVSFVQDNQSCSTRNTLRGLHMQVRKPQGKLVRVVSGEIWDVAVDVRAGSATFGRWFGTYLSSDNFRQLYVPEGCAHGFCVVSKPPWSNTSALPYTTQRTKSESPSTTPCLTSSGP